MMNLTVLFSSFLIFVHPFGRFSCGMDLETLQEAIACDNIQIVKRYLSGENMHRVLHEALIEVKSDFLELMESRENSHYRLPGNGALHLAVINTAPKVTRLLLENGANVNIMNFEGETPLLLASEAQNPFSDAFPKKNAQVIDALLEFNPDVHIRNDYDLSPIMCAAGSCNVSLVAKIFARGGNVNDKWMGPRKTPLHRAVYYGCVEVTKFLLDNGAEADADNAYSENVLHMIFNTRKLYWVSSRRMGRKDQAAIAKLLLRSENVENMLKQRENRFLKTPVDIFFEQSDPNREIMLDLLKTLPSLDDVHAESALGSFSPSLVQHSSTWPPDNFPEYVKIAFNSYYQIFSIVAFYQNSFIGSFSKGTGVEFISPTFGIKFFIENGLTSLYVILKSMYFRIHGGEDREEAVREVEKFEEYLHELSVPFQNALWNAVAKSTSLEILPTEILTKIFQHSQYAPYIERMAKIISLVLFTQTQGWSVEEMADAAAAFMNYVEQTDILLL